MRGRGGPAGRLASGWSERARQVVPSVSGAAAALGASPTLARAAACYHDCADWVIMPASFILPCLPCLCLPCPACSLVSDQFGLRAAEFGWVLGAFPFIGCRWAGALGDGADASVCWPALLVMDGLRGGDH